MQLLALVILLASSWYLLKLINNFLDEPTKKTIAINLSKSKDNLKKIKLIFKKETLDKAWAKYKQERGALANKD